MPVKRREKVPGTMSRKYDAMSARLEFRMLMVRALFLIFYSAAVATAIFSAKGGVIIGRSFGVNGPCVIETIVDLGTGVTPDDPLSMAFIKSEVEFDDLQGKKTHGG